MKLVFLDFDGVINSNKIEEETYDWRAFHANVSNFNRLVKFIKKCNENNVRIVVSSTWRLTGVERIGSYFYKFGMERKLAREIFRHRTPRIVGAKRGDEILRYLKDEELDIDKIEFAIIDDDMGDIACFKNLKNKCVWINVWTGIIDTDVEKALSLLDLKGAI